MADGEIQVDTELDGIKGALQIFLEANPHSSVERTTTGNGKRRIQIAKPWGDPSLVFALPEGGGALIDVLNNVILPQRLAAIYHKDKRSLEIIWTAFKATDQHIEVVGRKFAFNYNNKKHVCHFTKSSDRLLALAEAFVPISAPDYLHRNLTSFSRYVKTAEADRERVGLNEPKSFWVSNVTWSEASTLAMLETLNFYLSYFDEQSPFVIIFAPSNATPVSSKTRYMHGAFPETINARSIDDNLITFWNAARSGNASTQFVLYFRIIEYASHHYLDEKVRMDIKRLISNPNLPLELESTMEKIVSACVPGRQEDIPKLKGVLRTCVRSELLWREIKSNLDFFKKETKFDGGFVVRPLITSDDKQSTWENNWVETFSDRIKDIRNVLSHGRDQKTGKVITATQRNYQLLRPWVHLIAIAAAEVAIYKDIS